MSQFGLIGRNFDIKPFPGNDKSFNYLNKNFLLLLTFLTNSQLSFNEKTHNL